jgi:hypothetical protein
MQLLLLSSQFRPFAVDNTVVKHSTELIAKQQVEAEKTLRANAPR